MRRTALVTVLAATCTVLGTLGAAGGASSAALQHVRPVVMTGADAVGQHHPTVVFGRPPSSLRRATGPDLHRYCWRYIHIHCYTTIQIAHAYGFDTLHNAGLDGTGRAILVSVAFGSPTVRHDLAVASRQLGLPPADVEIRRPLGPIPPFDPNNATMTDWAFETTLDTQLIHAYAPGAKIVIVETPTPRDSDSTEADDVVIRQGGVDVMNQSWIDGELNHQASWYRALDYVYKDANAAGVTSVAATGDWGATEPDVDGSALYPYRTVGWPSTDPLNVAAGGTQLHLDLTGDRTKPDTVWNDQDLFGHDNVFSTGGGVSSYYPRPAYQDRVANIVGNRRGVPDVSLSAAVRGAVYIYLSWNPTFAGWYYAGGTSEAAPTFSSLVAIADQAAGRRLGNVLPALYGAADHPGKGIVDVTSGNNTVTFADPLGGGDITVHGYTARTGYDLASGLGTVDAPSLVATLVGSSRPRG